MKSFREFLNGLDTDFKEFNNGKTDIILVRELRKCLASFFIFLEKPKNLKKKKRTQ